MIKGKKMRISTQLNKIEVPLCVICNENPARIGCKTCSEECSKQYTKQSKERYMEQYQKTERFRQSQKRYQKTKSFKQSQDKYHKSDKFKQSQKRYRLKLKNLKNQLIIFEE